MAVINMRRAPRELGYRGRQVKCMIEQWLNEYGRSPTTHEIMKHLDFYDRAGVCRVIGVLERRAIISRVGTGKVRGRTVLRLVINNN